MQELQPVIITMTVILLNLLGKFLKEWKLFPNEMIPQLLGVIGGLVGYILFKDVNAIMLGLASVGVHQSFKQVSDKKDNQK